MIQHTFDFSIQQFWKLAHFFSSTPKTVLLWSGDSTQESPSSLFLFPSSEITLLANEPNPWDLLKKSFPSPNDNPYPEWAGYLSYELSATSDLDVTLPSSPSPLPLAQFFKASVVCTYQKGKLNVQCHTKEARRLQGKALYWFYQFQKRELLESFLFSLKDFEKPPLVATNIEEEVTADDYLEKISVVKEYILQGECYQINLSRKTVIETPSKPFDLFYALVHKNPTPFSAYLFLEKQAIISASPERFLKYKEGRLTTCPIKGTAPRGKTPDEDLSLQKALLASLKEDAELTMICDLMRNDLGKISQIGSVSCPNRKKLLSFSNVYHLESTVCSTPYPQHAIDLIRACFPAGSITGCPKLRAQEIIEKLEKRPRHIYCGSIGYFTGNHEFDFNVAIRTALMKDNLLEVQLGGAITLDSDPLQEFLETRHKGSPFLDLLTPSAPPAPLLNAPLVR